MKTQCPNCKNCFDIPDEYEGRNITCFNCKYEFRASAAKPVVVEKKSINPETRLSLLSLLCTIFFKLIAVFGIIVSLLALVSNFFSGQFLYAAAAFVTLSLGCILATVLSLQNTVRDYIFRREKKFYKK